MTRWIAAVPDDWLALGACLVTMGLCMVLLYVFARIRTGTRADRRGVTPGPHALPPTAKTNGAGVHAQFTPRTRLRLADSRLVPARRRPPGR